MDRVNFSAEPEPSGRFLRQSDPVGSSRQKKTREVLRPPAFWLKGNSLGLQIDLDGEGFLLGVLGIVLVLAAATTTARAGASEDSANGKSGENRCEKEDFFHRPQRLPKAPLSQCLFSSCRRICLGALPFISFPCLSFILPNNCHAKNQAPTGGWLERSRAPFLLQKPCPPWRRAG